MIERWKFGFLKDSIVAFDKGCVNYQSFKSLTDKGGFFVTRLRLRAIYHVEECRYVDNRKGIHSECPRVETRCTVVAQNWLLRCNDRQVL